MDGDAGILGRVEARLVAGGLLPAAGGYLDQRRRDYADDLRRLRRLHAGGALVEVGGFPFIFSACLREAGWDAVTVDLDPGRLGALVAAERLTVHRCDVEREPLPFATGSVATVVLAATFEHLRVDPLFALEEIARVLRPGGVLYLTTTNFYRLANLVSLVSGRGPLNDPLREYGKLRHAGHMGHVREYTRREMVRLLEACGFTGVRVGFRHAGPSPRGAWLDGLYAVLPPLRPDLVAVARAGA